MTLYSFSTIGNRTEASSPSSRLRRKAVSLNTGVATRLSFFFHSRPEFAGLPLAAVVFEPGWLMEDLQILFADEAGTAAARLARVYELMAEVLRSTGEAKCNRFVLSQEGSDVVACGICVVSVR